MAREDWIKVGQVTPSGLIIIDKAKVEEILRRVLDEYQEGKRGPNRWDKRNPKVEPVPKDPILTKEDMESPEVKDRTCRKCGGKMEWGDALMNGVYAGVPDFPGDDENSPGQTLSFTGPAKLVRVMKCNGCGHSFTV
jgi:hypothetical protein